MARRTVGGPFEGGFVQLGFYAQGEGPHLQIAKYLIESAQKVMPDVPIFQLTDDKTPEIEGAKAVRIGGEMPMGVRRLTHYAALGGDWLFVDTDVLFKRDVRDVFDSKAFDVAIAEREGTYMAGTKYAERNPYNFGVVFSRNQDFWRMLLPHLKQMDPAAQEWGGEQLLTCELIHMQDSPFSVRILPSSYNFTPYRETDDVADKHILHLKGPRKSWITMFR